MAIVVATVVVQFAYWPVVGSLGTSAEGETAVAVPLLAVGMATVPFAMLVLALVSRQPDGGSATLQALGLFLLVGPALVVLVGPLTGMVAGLSSGGVAALQRDRHVHPLAWRWIAVAAVTVYTLVLQFVAVEFALMSGAVLPFAVHGLVDQAAETR